MCFTCQTCFLPVKSIRHPVPSVMNDITCTQILPSVMSSFSYCSFEFIDEFLIVLHSVVRFISCFVDYLLHVLQAWIPWISSTTYQTFHDYFEQDYLKHALSYLIYFCNGFKIVFLFCSFTYFHYRRSVSLPDLIIFLFHQSSN